jgi:hypothetical protein
MALWDRLITPFFVFSAFLSTFDSSGSSYHAFLTSKFAFFISLVLHRPRKTTCFVCEHRLFPYIYDLQSLPIIKGIYLFEVKNIRQNQTPTSIATSVRFGLWGYCVGAYQFKYVGPCGFVFWPEIEPEPLAVDRPNTIPQLSAAN